MFAPFTATPLRFAPDHLAIVAGTKGSTAGRCRIGGDDGQRNLRMRIIIPDDIHRGEQNAREQRAPDPVAKRDQPAQQGRDEGEHRHYRHIKPIHGRQIDGHRLLLLATRNPFSLSDAAAPREIKLRARKAAMPSSHVAQPCRPATSPSHATELCRAWQYRVRGMRDRDIAAIAQCYSQRHGSENGIYLCASMPPDKPVQFSQRHYQNRVIKEGDTIALLVEDSGPGGMYTELGRSCVVGKASSELKDEFAFALEARKFNLALLKPGAACKDIFAEYNAFMRKNGRPEEKRLHCHGQGYDLVERPLIRNDEPMSIERHMNIVVHPTYIRGRVLSWVCDNYLIGPNGPGERLHRFPETITELG